MPRDRIGFKINRNRPKARPTSESKTPKAITAKDSTIKPGQSLSLPSGRKLSVENIGGNDAIQIRSQDNQTLEVEILLTPEGPKLRLRHTSIEIDAVKSLQLNCEDLTIKSSKSVQVEAAEDLIQKAGGKTVMTSEEDTVIKGKLIHLN